MTQKDSSQREYSKGRIFEILNNNRNELQREILRLQSELKEIDSIIKLILPNEENE